MIQSAFHSFRVLSLSSRHAIAAAIITLTLVVKIALPKLLNRYRLFRARRRPVSCVESVNFHFNRNCNYECKFCFHTASSLEMKNLDEQKRGLRMLADAGMRKINFSGGEPLLYKRVLGELIRYCREDLKIESVTLVSNGSLADEKWFEKYGRLLHVFAISCDSFDPVTDLKTGRAKKKAIKQFESRSKDLNETQLDDLAKEILKENGGSQASHAFKVAKLCKKFGVQFKINTVVNKNNMGENMVAAIKQLNPSRWKVFQCLLIEGDNFGEGALRDAKDLVITQTEFQGFLARHAVLDDILKPEDNDTMKNSYLILDEEMRFLNNQNGRKVPTESILAKGMTVELARSDAGFDADAYVKRDGRYLNHRGENTWAELPACAGPTSPTQSNLEW